jgi:hypothetical protein
LIAAHNCIRAAKAYKAATRPAEPPAEPQEWNQCFLSFVTFFLPLNHKLETVFIVTHIVQSIYPWRTFVWCVCQLPCVSSKVFLHSHETSLKSPQAHICLMRLPPLVSSKVFLHSYEKSLKSPTSALQRGCEPEQLLGSAVLGT